MSTLRDLFLLDPQVIFLNHGSFGATPRPVFDAYQAWQRRLEAQPVQFVVNDLPGYFAAARQRLADCVQAAPADLVYVPNATFGVNVVARSLKLAPGDEVLASDHEYGACDNAWEFVCRQREARYVRQPISLPVSSAEEMAAQFWQGVTPRTRVIFLSHISSPTALRLPVELICARARQAGILTMIDGAHAPGQIDLNLPALEADFYTGNCHKWMMSAKGAGFLYARPEVQPLIEPLIVSWGYGPHRDFSFGSDFLDYLQWWGTKDPAAALSVPAALDFMAEHDWTAVRRHCHALAAETLARIGELTCLPPIYSPTSDFFGQMFAAPLPPVDAKRLKRRLYEEYRVEAPIVTWNGRPFIRVSIQGYNSRADADALLAALHALLGE